MVVSSTHFAHFVSKKFRHFELARGSWENVFSICVREKSWAKWNEMDLNPLVKWEKPSYTKKNSFIPVHFFTLLSHSLAHQHD